LKPSSVIRMTIPDTFVRRWVSIKSLYAETWNCFYYLFIYPT
jgi:hypothetical protein